jgi:single-strand DNA-binding protein
MRSVNKVFLYGNLGSNPETRTTLSGKAVTTFSMATNRSKKVGDGYESEADWHKVVSFDWMAKRAAEKLQKGQPVAVVGSIRPRKWTDDEGTIHRKTEIYAENLCFGPLALANGPIPDLATQSVALEDCPAIEPSAVNDAPLPENVEVPF